MSELYLLIEFLRIQQPTTKAVPEKDPQLSIRYTTSGGTKLSKALQYQHKKYKRILI